MTTDDAWREAATLVLAEWRRLLLAAERLTLLEKEGQTGSDTFNAFLESFLLHYRNILDFLSPRQSGRQEHDVTAGEFLVRAPTRHRAAIDFRLAHISKRRLAVPAEEKGWDIATMMKEIGVAWDGFLAALAEAAPERLAWFKDHPQDQQGTAPRLIASEWLRSATTTGPESVTMTTIHYGQGTAPSPPS